MALRHKVVVDIAVAAVDVVSIAVAAAGVEIVAAAAAAAGAVGGATEITDTGMAGFTVGVSATGDAGDVAAGVGAVIAVGSCNCCGNGDNSRLGDACLGQVGVTATGVSVAACGVSVGVGVVAGGVTMGSAKSGSALPFAGIWLSGTNMAKDAGVGVGVGVGVAVIVGGMAAINNAERQSMVLERILRFFGARCLTATGAAATVTGVATVVAAGAVAGVATAGAAAAELNKTPALGATASGKCCCCCCCCCFCK